MPWRTFSRGFYEASCPLPCDRFLGIPLQAFLKLSFRAPFPVILFKHFRIFTRFPPCMKLINRFKIPLQKSSLFALSLSRYFEQVSSQQRLAADNCSREINPLEAHSSTHFKSLGCVAAFNVFNAINVVCALLHAVSKQKLNRSRRADSRL